MKLKRGKDKRASEVDANSPKNQNRNNNQNRTSKEGRFTPAGPRQLRSGTSGGKPPFLTCSILALGTSTV